MATRKTTVPDAAGTTPAAPAKAASPKAKAPATSKAKAPAAKKVTASKQPAAAPVAAAPKATKAKVATRANRPKASVNGEQRAHYVEVAAFYIAERRGFAPGDPLADWVAAEAEIDRLIAEGKLGGR